MNDHQLALEASHRRSPRPHCDIVLKDNSFKFYYHGFWPGSILREEVGELLFRVLDFTPVQVGIASRIERSETGFRVFVMLSFQDGAVFAVHSGPTPGKAMQRTLDQVRLKLKRWGGERFLSSKETGSGEKFSRQADNMEMKSRSIWKFTPKVLIVDDNPLSIKLIDACLRFQGCETNVVTNGSEAAHEISRVDYDLMVLDWQMPELNGAETLECAQDIITYNPALRVPWSTSQMPVITYSGEEQSRMQFPQCENFQLMGYIAKSTTFPELKRATSSFLHALCPE